jgi:hypothetical protein
MSTNDENSNPPEKNILVTRGNDYDPYGKGGGQSGSGGNSGWRFGSGGGGGFFSGGFGGSSRKKAKKRAKARRQAIARQRAEAEARARAEAEALAQARREAAHRQLIETFGQAYSVTRSELDTAYGSKLSTLAHSLESEINAAKKPPNSQGNERWQLYLISKEKSELEGLITQKNSELQVREGQARAFNGHDPLTQTAEDYQRGLVQHSGNAPERVQQAHDQWLQAYRAAHEARILSQSLKTLMDRSQALSAHYAKEEVKWREIDAVHERHRQYGERREEHITHKRRLDEQVRRDSIKTANTLQAPGATMAAGAVVWGRGGALVVEGTAAALESSIVASVKELGRVAAIRAGQTLSISLSALLYSEPLGNGELTPEQRRRLFRGMSVGAEALGLQQNVDLQAIADAGGSVELATRIKAIPVEQGTELRGITTGGALAANVPVIKAVHDPLTDTYRAQTPGVQPKHLVVGSSISVPADTSGSAAQPELFTGEQQISEVPPGVDTRINDCIVCFPAEAGLAPQYVSFATSVSDLGFVVGNGQAASDDWWKQASQGQVVALPAQIGEQLRYREFSSIEAFNKSTWLAIADNPTLSKQFGEINLKRIARGFPPLAPKSAWVGERREFEFRNSQAANDAGIYFSLDQLSISRPDSTYGVPRLTPTFLPWPTSGARTWTPLVPPGSEALGPTELPVETGQPTLYPGETTEPVGSQNESLPAVDPEDVNASIPGFGEGDDVLPSPDLVFAKPVQPLEVGPYNGLAWRSNRDGLDIDHIVSRQALKRHILLVYPGISDETLKGYLARGPSIAIPHEIHRRFSETYAGRNTEEKQTQDAKDLRAAVNSNFDAIKVGLLEVGFEEAQIEKAREELHELIKEQGWYE